MVDSSYKPAGTYNLKSFVIKPFLQSQQTNADGDEVAIDIKLLIHTWEVIESIMSGAVRGSAKVYDSVGLLYDFPLRGEELIEVVYEDWRGEEITEKFILYSISDVKPTSTGGDLGLEYKISFVSIGKFISDKYDVRRCIAAGFGASRNYIPASDQAQVLFQDYYQERGNGTEKELYVTPSDGAQKIVIPSMRPEDAMHLLSRKAWSADYQSQNFRFFETRERYYFANIEDLIAFPDNQYSTKYFYSTRPTDNSPDAEFLKMQTILAYEFPSINNSHENMLNGAFYRKTNELNLSERIEIVNEYKHLDQYRNYVYPDSAANLGFMDTNEFIENHLDRYHRDYVIKDYPSADESPVARQRPATFYPDIYNRKGAMVHHYNSSRLNIKVFGNNKLFPGMTVEIELPEQKTANVIDKDRSGRYVIESIRNFFHEFTYYQDITLSKGGILND